MQRALTSASPSGTGSTIRAIVRDGLCAVVDRETGAWALAEALPAEGLDGEARVFPRHHRAVGDAFARTAGLLDELRPHGRASRSDERLDTLIIKLTNRCNEACLYCYDAKGQREVDIDLERTLDAVTAAVELAGDTLTVLFHGGEPLLMFREMQALVERAATAAARSGKTARFAIQTNAALLRDDIVDFLQSHDFDVGISVDGDEATHDRYRVMKNGTGSYRYFRRALERFPEFLTEGCGILTTVTASNVAALPDIARHFESLGFLTWNTTLYAPMGRGAAVQHMEARAEDYARALLRLVDMIEDGAFRWFALKPLFVYLDNLASMDRPNMCMPGNGACGAGTRLLNIASDGSIGACDMIIDGGLELGHLSECSLESAYRSDAVALVQGRPQHLAQCRQCTWMGMCGGTCLGRSSLHGLKANDCKVSRLLFEDLLFRLGTSKPLQDYYGRFEGARRAREIAARRRGGEP